MTLAVARVVVRDDQVREAVQEKRQVGGEETVGTAACGSLYQTRLSKLCEFCINSCAERRKMTAVN